MNKLVQAGLFGAGLVPVNTPELVSRYNQSLKELGIEPTTLAEFQVDGLGWSPEIATEKGDNYYLSHGVSNQLAIVISPDQRLRPIYFPFTSYDRRLMIQYFEKFIAQITDITVTTCVCLDIDNEMSKYRSPLDLLLVDYVIVRSMANDLIEAAREQQQLVQKFQQADQAWSDPSLRERISASAKAHGDLRFRSVEITDWQFADLASFHTRALGGVFVFRGLPGSDQLLIIEDGKELKKLKNQRNVIGIADKALLSRLYDEELVEVDLAWYQEHPEIIEEKLDCLLAELICTSCPETDYLNLTLAQKKGLLDKYGSDMPKVFHDLERLRRQLDRGDVPPYQRLSRDLRVTLLHPNQNLCECLQETVSRLIARLQPLSLLNTFTCDKELFYRRYSAWPEAKKLWAIETIKKHYKPRMHALAENCQSNIP